MSDEEATTFGTFGDLHVTIGDDFVATAEVRRPPNNFFDLDLIDSLAAAISAVDAEPDGRAGTQTDDEHVRAIGELQHEAAPAR